MFGRNKETIRRWWQPIAPGTGQLDEKVAGEINGSQAAEVARLKRSRDVNGRMKAGGWAAAFLGITSVLAADALNIVIPGSKIAWNATAALGKVAMKVGLGVMAWFEAKDRLNRAKMETELPKSTGVLFRKPQPAHA